MRAEPDAIRHRESARWHATLASEMLLATEFRGFATAAADSLKLLISVKELSDIKAIAESLGRIPFPVIQVAMISGAQGRSPNRPVSEPTDAKNAPNGPFVIKVMFEIEGRPWSTPQLVLTKTIYDLQAKATIAGRPDWATRLELIPVTTLSAEQYDFHIPPFSLPASSQKVEMESSGHVQFTDPQSLLSKPISIKLLGQFTSGSGQTAPATIVGYHELRVRIADSKRTHVLSKYRAIDLRIAENDLEIQRLAQPVEEPHLEDFVAALGSITNFMGINLQEARYRDTENVAESDFHSHLLRHMRMQLGEDVSNAPKIAGGPTDIVYRSIVTEVKVEDRISDREKMIEKYIGQPTQYSAGLGARLAILCILDMTEKRCPPANPQNNVRLETPPLHGFEPGTATYDTRIAVVIIDGKLKWPSSYSR